MSAVFQSPSDLSGYLFRIVDNGGSSADRYTVVFSDGSYLALSGSPTHPQGISMWGEGIDPAVLQEWVENGEAIDLALGDLPPHLVQHIVDRNNEGLRDFLDAVESKASHAVAGDRESAEENDGSSSSLGKGIYWSDEGYRIRLDGHPGDDRGPFTDAAEAVRHSLPDEYSLSGPEYHSGVDVMRLEPDPAIGKAIEDLETKRNEEWVKERSGGLTS